MLGAAKRTGAIKLRLVVVEILDGGGPEVVSQGQSQVDVAWMFILWGNTLSLGFADELCWDDFAAKITSKLACVFKV